MTTQTEIQTKHEIQIKKLISLVEKVEKDFDRRDDLKWDIQELVETMVSNNMKRELETIMWDRYYRRFPNSIKCIVNQKSAIKDFCQDFKIYGYISLDFDEIKERQMNRRIVYKNLPCDMWKGRSKLARFINHCGRFMNEDFANEGDEYQAMKILENSYDNISRADMIKHWCKWLGKFARDFGCYDYMLLR